MDCLPRRRRTRSDVLGWRAPDGKIGELIVLSCGELAAELLRRRLFDRPRSPLAAARPIMVPTPGERSPGKAHPALSAPAAGPGVRRRELRSRRLAGCKSPCSHKAVPV